MSAYFLMPNHYSPVRPRDRHAPVPMGWKEESNRYESPSGLRGVAAGSRLQIRARVRLEAAATRDKALRRRMEEWKAGVSSVKG